MEKVKPVQTESKQKAKTDTAKSAMLKKSKNAGKEQVAPRKSARIAQQALDKSFKLPDYGGKKPRGALKEVDKMTTNRSEKYTNNGESKPRGNLKTGRKKTPKTNVATPLTKKLVA